MSKRILLPALAALVAVTAVPAPVAAEVIKEDDDGFVTRDSVVVEASPYETWATLITPGKWWNSAHTWSGDAGNMYISVQGGGCFCELLPEREDKPENLRRGSVQHMLVLMADPPRVLRMRGSLGPLQSEPVDGVLTVTLQPEGGGTKIVWEYVVGGYMRFEIPVIAKAVDGVMSQQMNGLADMLGRVEGADDEPAADDMEEPVAEDVDAIVEDAADRGDEDPDDVGAALDAMARKQDER